MSSVLYQPEVYVRDVRAFKELMNKLHLDSPQTLHTPTLARGDVVATIDGGSWSRAQVVSWPPGEEDLVLLRYLDNGDCRQVPLKFVKPIWYISGWVCCNLYLMVPSSAQP